MIVIYLFGLIILILLIALFDPFEFLNDDYDYLSPTTTKKKYKQKHVRFSNVRRERHYNIKNTTNIYDIIGDTTGVTDTPRTNRDLK